jgi:chromosome segregation ATPase
MTLEPNEIDLDALPRTIGGGLKREPVEELLKRVQWEYSQLYFQQKRLKEELANGRNAAPPAQFEQLEAERQALAERLEQRDADIGGLRQELERRDTEVEALRVQLAAAPEPAPQRIAQFEQLEAERQALADRLEQRDADIGGLRQELERRDAEVEALQVQLAAASEPAPPSPPPAPRRTLPGAHREFDELARIVLENAHHASIALRESTRRDCDVILKKVRERAAWIERTTEEGIADQTAELERLEVVLNEMREQMHGLLETLNPGQPPLDQSSAEQTHVHPMHNSQDAPPPTGLEAAS